MPTSEEAGVGIVEPGEPELGVVMGQATSRGTAVVGQVDKSAEGEARSAGEQLRTCHGGGRGQPLAGLQGLLSRAVAVALGPSWLAYAPRRRGSQEILEHAGSLGSDTFRRKAGFEDCLGAKPKQSLEKVLSLRLVTKRDHHS